MTHLFAFGLGYSAGRLAQRLANDGWRITGTSRTPEGAAAITARGWRAMTFDASAPNPALTPALASATHVLVSIPPDSAGDPALRCHRANLAAAPHLEWIGYFSTVGVYGDHAGGAVDEDTPTTPGSDRGRRRCGAEQDWLAFAAATGKRVTLFRLPGIYGPGRSVVDTLKAGAARRIVKPGQVFNRIHVDDIATAVAAAMIGPTRHAVYNVTDDEPTSSEDVLVFAARMLGLPEPQPIDFATASLSPMAASFYAESKRVSNHRLKTDLGVTLRYPTFREGLSAIIAKSPLEETQHPFNPRR